MEEKVQNLQESQVSEQPKPKKKKGKIKLLISTIIAIVIIAIAVIIIAVISNGNKVLIEDYIANNIEFSGYDGYGKIETLNNDLIDYDSLYTALEIKQSGLASVIGSDNILKSYFDISCTDSDSENLKNGDIVTYKITVKYDGINNLGDKKLSGDDVITVNYKVAGLEEVIELDPFEPLENVVVYEERSNYFVSLQFADKVGDYDISTKGINYSIKLGTTDEDGNEKTIGVDFSHPDIDNISAGDIITITLDEDVDEYANKYGVLFTQTSKEYEILTASVLTDGSKITKASYDEYKTAFEKNISSLDDGKYTFVDMYFYSGKSVIGSYVSTSITALCKFKHDAVGSEDVYVTFSVRNPMIASNGELTKAYVIFSGNDEYSSINEFEKQWGSDGGGFTVTRFEKINAK